MKPTLMFDKSTFEALKAVRHDAVQSAYEVIATASLVHEIARDMEIGRDGEKQRNPTARVRSLADRFRDNYTFQADWTELVRREFEGVTVWMNGKPTTQDHELGYVNGLQIGMRALMGKRAMTAKEHWLRRALAGQAKPYQPVPRDPFSAEKLAGRLSDRMYPLAAGSKTHAEQQVVVATVATFMDAIENVPELLHWLSESTPTPGQDAEARGRRMQRRWRTLGKPPFKKLAPYAYHCAQVSLLYVVGYNVWPNPRRPNDEKDLDYVRYLPFCNVLASGDKCVRAMSSHLVNESYQRVISTEQLRVELEAQPAGSRPEDRGPVSDAQDL